MSRSKDKSLGRRAAVQALYRQEVMFGLDDESARDIDVPVEVGMNDYAHTLIDGVLAHITTIDAHIADASQGWDISRISLVDKQLLRASIYEMLFVDEVPIAVSINEIVEIAKEFGSDDDSHRFINGILGKIARELELA